VPAVSHVLFCLGAAVWLAAPVIVGGLLHIAVMQRGAFAPLAAMPIDGGLTVRGRRLFGENKTLRGVVFLILFSSMVAEAQAWLVTHTAWAKTWSVAGTAGLPAWAWGALLATGYLAGELPNSFLKRQLDIAPGAGGRGALGPLFWVIDQVDSLLGALAAIALVWRPPMPLVLAAIAMTLIIHPLVTWLMKALGLKARVG
jgi:hypothetical protein